MMEEVLRKGASLEVVRAVVNAMARQFADGEVLDGMSNVILASQPVIARMAAEVTGVALWSDELRTFLLRNQQAVSPQVLAVFDWHLCAPSYLKDAYKHWQTQRRRMPYVVWGLEGTANWTEGGDGIPNGSKNLRRTVVRRLSRSMVVMTWSAAKTVICDAVAKSWLVE